jgi:hypothetical protein
VGGEVDVVVDDVVVDDVVVDDVVVDDVVVLPRVLRRVVVVGGSVVVVVDVVRRRAAAALSIEDPTACLADAVGTPIAMAVLTAAVTTNALRSLRCMPHPVLVGHEPERRRPRCRHRRLDGRRFHHGKRAPHPGARSPAKPTTTHAVHESVELRQIRPRQGSGTFRPKRVIGTDAVPT